MAEAEAAIPWNGGVLEAAQAEAEPEERRLSCGVVFVLFGLCNSYTL